ncbi:nucleotidyltransferase family protein [Parasphingopyxis lamellibrachiae]|uniref:Molybdenum cofactor cytidylyltransferase n=1 Tax=Parasphingopyxis lamellibrachiae TaxID=680125 RepID=A0A3D9FDN5_9SPHN|nr:NTP transferase domain-containing protein [Parasphingopyxis lamellibrachiae]RED15682.1 molybdenum cofactor cytidylyltransferase [Parasphingopyxis lamellibrachiae]
MRAAIILAAGRSRRFGIANKLLVRRHGKTLLQSAVQIALSAPVCRVIVVTSVDDARLRGAVLTTSNSRVSVLFARDHRDGHHASLLHGLNALRRREREALVFLGDMPDLTPATARRLTRLTAAGYKAVRPSYQDTPGHPVLIRDVDWVCKRLETGMPPFGRDEVLHVNEGRHTVLDIDRPGDLQRIGSRR